MDEDNLLADIPLEGDTVEEVLDQVDKELQDEDPAESLPEKEEVEKLDLPDESVLKKNKAWEEMRLKNEALEQRLKDLEKSDSKEKSEFISTLVGDNEEVEEKWNKEKMSLKEELKREMVQEKLDAERQAQENKQKWIDWTNERLSEVEKEFKVDFKADESKKNALSKIMLEYTPTDNQGNLDYRKGMILLNQLEKAKEAEKSTSTQAKKNLADATVSKETSVEKNKDYYTSADLKGKDWRSL